MSDLPTPASTHRNERRVLVLPTTRADGLAIGKLFGANDIEFDICADTTQLRAAQRDGAGTLLVSEEALIAQPADLFACVEGQPVWSDLPVVVLSRTGREPLVLAESVARLGNVSVVERPIRTSTLVSLVRSSLRARDRQYQVREYLVQQDHAQKIIREGERRYRSLIENLTDYAIFMTTVEGKVSSWNDGAEAILGYSAGEVVGQSIDLFSTQEDIDANVSVELMNEARNKGRAASDGWKLRKDGRRLYIEGIAISVLDESGQLAGFAHFLKDVTEKELISAEREALLESERVARAEAERASRMKDEFLATLSHELRTPLASVLGWTQVMRRMQNLPPEAENALAVIERNARSQAQIIADLLDMSRIISGKVRLDVQPLDLASLVTATVETVRPAAQAKNIHLNVVLDPMAGAVRGDPNRLQQVLWNLLTNAVKFTPKDGRVTVTLARVDAHLEVEVSDTGEGIDPAFLPHMFDRFRQADATSTRQHGGLGLGLSIVKQLVEMHGGSISATSAGRGQGARFRVSLPLTPTAEDFVESESERENPTRSSAASVLEQIPATSLQGINVLVVDDEPDARSLVQRLLEECDASVSTAASVSEAIQDLLNRAPDVIVSDIGMPGEDGYSLMRRVRAMNGGTAKIPAIALTAYARMEDRVKAIQAGFQLHLSKPVEPAELVAMVASLARGTAQRRED